MNLIGIRSLHGQETQFCCCCCCCFVWLCVRLLFPCLRIGFWLNSVVGFRLSGADDDDAGHGARPFPFHEINQKVIAWSNANQPSCRRFYSRLHPSPLFCWLICPSFISHWPAVGCPLNGGIGQINQSDWIGLDWIWWIIERSDGRVEPSCGQREPARWRPWVAFLRSE